MLIGLASTLATQTTGEVLVFKAGGMLAASTLQTAHDSDDGPKSASPNLKILPALAAESLNGSSTCDRPIAVGMGA